MGSHPVAVVQYPCTQTIQETSQNKQNTKNTKIHRTTQKIHRETQQLERMRAVPRLCGFYPGICLTTEEKARKNLSQAINVFMALFLFNTLKPELNPICYLLALLGARHFLHVSRIRVKLLIFRLLMSYIYGAPILDVSSSHTTTQHSR